MCSKRRAPFEAAACLGLCAVMVVTLTVVVMRKHMPSAVPTAPREGNALAVPHTTTRPTPSPEHGICRPSSSGGFERAVFTTTKGDITFELRPDLAPSGAARLKEMVRGVQQRTAPHHIVPHRTALHHTVSRRTAQHLDTSHQEHGLSACFQWLCCLIASGGRCIPATCTA